MAVLQQIVKVFRDANGPFSGRFRKDGNDYVAPEHHIAGDDGAPVIGAASDAAWDGEATTPTWTALFKAMASKLLGTVAVSAQALPLPSGAATAAKQDSTLATLLSQIRGQDSAGNDLPANFANFPQTIVNAGTTTTVSVTNGTNTWVQTISGVGTPSQSVSAWVKQ